MVSNNFFKFEIRIKLLQAKNNHNKNNNLLTIFEKKILKIFFKGIYLSKCAVLSDLLCAARTVPCCSFEISTSND